MRPRLLVLGWALLFSGFVCLTQAQMLQLGVGVPRAVGGGGTCTGPGLALDGTPGHSTGSNNASFNVVVTTTSTNDVIVLYALVNGGPVTTVTSPSLTWAKRGTGGTTPFLIDEWFAISAGTLTGETITVSQTSTSFITLNAFGISGANTVSTFDGTVVTGNADPLSITTSFANTMIIGGFRGSTSNTTQGAGYTLISGQDFALSEYKVVTSTQSGLGIAVGTGVGTMNGAVADAVKCI